MTETPTGGPALPRATPPGVQVSDRMQALLSKAVEDQVSEQRTVATLLAEMRVQINGITDGLRLAATESSVERLSGAVTTVVSDLRTSTSLLGQRIEALSKRVETVAADVAEPAEQSAVRLTALAGDVAAQGEAVERMQLALEQLAAFPAALSALQGDVAGVHDRLEPLASLRAGLDNFGAEASTSLATLAPRLDALERRLVALADSGQAEQIRNKVVDALGGRLQVLEEASGRPVVGPDVLRAALGELRSSLDSARGEQLDLFASTLTAIENRLGQLGQRVADIGDAAGGIPSLTTDVSRITSRFEDLQTLRHDLTAVAEIVRRLDGRDVSEDTTAALATLQADLLQLSDRVAAAAPPRSEDVAAMVSQRVADRLVETLAPRIADTVLTRVSGALVTQLGEALSPRLRADTDAIVKAATTDSERRILAHVDEAVLALAEALLRRRPTSKSAPPVRLTKSKPAAEPAAAAEPVQEVVDHLNEIVDEVPEETTPAPRPSVTMGKAPSRSVPAKATPPAEPDDSAERAEPAAPPVPRPVAAKAVRPAKAAPAPEPLKPAPRPGARPQATRPEARPQATRPVRKAPPRPIVDRTPDLPEDDEPTPVERVQPRLVPESQTSPLASQTSPLASQTSPPAPQASPPPPAEDDDDKRKPWWRP